MFSMNAAFSLFAALIALTHFCVMYLIKYTKMFKIFELCVILETSSTMCYLSVIEWPMFLKNSRVKVK